MTARGRMRMTDNRGDKVRTDDQRLTDLYDRLYDLISFCTSYKKEIKALDNWKIAHELDSTLCLAFETLRRRLTERGLN